MTSVKPRALVKMARFWWTLTLMAPAAALGQHVLVYDHATVTTHFSHNFNDCTYDDPAAKPDGSTGTINITYGETCKNQGNPVALHVDVILTLPAAPIVITSPPTSFHTSIVTTGSTDSGKIGGYVNLDPYHESRKSCDSGFSVANGAVFCDGLAPHQVGAFQAFGALVEYQYSDRDRDETLLIEAFYKDVDCSTPAPGCPSATDLTVDHIEVVQAAQTPDNSVPLVAGKSTVVRVFVKGSAPSGLSATLKAQGHSEQLTLDRFDVAPGIFQTPGGPDSRKDRTAFNFHPPLSWTAAGDLNVEAQLRLSSSTSPVKTEKVTFKDAPGWPKPYEVMYLQLCEPATTTVPLPTTTLCAGNSTPPTSLGDVDHLMARMFPIPDNGLHYFWFPSGVLLKDEDLKGDPTRAAFRKLRLIDSQLLNLLGPEAPDQLVAWYPQKGVIGKQIFEGLAPESTVETESPFGRAGIYDRSLKNRIGLGRLTLLNDATLPGSDILATTLASGIAHNLSDPLTHDTVRFGFDAEKNRDIPYDITDVRFDILGFTIIGHTPPMWISSDGFTSLFNAYSKFAPKPALQSSVRDLDRKQVVRRAVQATEYLNISGTARRDGSSGHLDAGFRTNSMFTGVASDPDGNHCLRFSGDSGVLGDYCFKVEFTNVITGADIDEDDFVVRTPWLAGTKKVALLRNGAELTSLTLSPNPPAVKIDSPGDSGGSGTMTILWTGTDADGDTLVYELLASTDGGATWTPVDPEIKESKYTLDASRFGANVMLQLLASDGLNTTAVSVGPTTSTPEGAHIDLPQTDVDFRSVAVGATRVQSLLIGNTGKAPLTVTAVAFDGDGFGLTSPPVPFVIPAGEQRSAMVRFAPAFPVAYSGNLTIKTDDPGQPAVPVTLHGVGTTTYNSDGDITPKILDFGDSAVGQPVDKPVTLLSFGPGSLRVNSVEVTGGGFSLTAPPGTFYLPASETKTIAVRFSPTHTGSHPGVLTIVTDDDKHPTLQVTLKGNGTGGGFPDPVTVSVRSLDFGAVNVGEQREMTVRVGNGGSAAVSVAAASSNARFTVLPASVSIDGRGSKDFIVRFAPNATATVAGKVAFSTAATAESIDVKGSGMGSGVGGTSILVAPVDLSFGAVGLGQSKDMTVRVYNTGTNALTVNAITSSNASFSASPQTFSVAAGASPATVTVHFSPAENGPQLGALVLLSNDATRPSLTVSVGGTGDSSLLNVSRTLVYHEITRFNRQVRFGNGAEPALSSSGNRVVYAHAPGDETDARYSHIFVMNSDGSGQREVDFYKQNCGCGALVDISADGNTVVSTDSVELRIASASGNTGRRLVTNREISYVRISPRGDRVFFIHRRGEASASDPTTERGLYLINADGSGLRQIAGPRAVAALFGNTPDQVFPFSTNGWSLDVSADGSRVVFGVNTPGGERLMSVNADGSGLKQLVGPVNYVNHAGISGDGNKVGYDVVPPPFLPNEVGVINFDGSGRRVLAGNVNAVSNLRMRVSSDGAKLLNGNSNRLYSTDGSGAVQLSIRGGYFSSDNGLLVTDNFELASMNGAGDRFVYSIFDDTGIEQLATLDINPVTLGAAPSISSPKLTQPTVALSGVTLSNVSATVDTGNKVTRVSAAGLNKGAYDFNLNAPVMVDDGRLPDVTAGDGIYTGILGSDCCAVLGPKTVRVKAEVRDGSNGRHATVIEFGGLAVVSK